MAPTSRRVLSRLATGLRRLTCLGAAGVFAFSGFAAEILTPVARTVGAEPLTTFDQIWRVAELPGPQRVRVRFEYLVYYYDPLWKAVWGRCGEADSYISFGSVVFPIKPGQRILVEGFMVPAKGMVIEEPKVTVLADEGPIPSLSTAGEVGNIERFNKRVVTMEGLVDRQGPRDANHLELVLIAEGRPVLLQLVVRGDLAPPLLRGSFVRAKGVYFARQESPGAPARIELWVQSSDDIEAIGRLDHDPRFGLPVTTIAQLWNADPNTLVRVVGTVRGQRIGSSLTVRDETGEISFAALQSRAIEFGGEVEAIGYPAMEGGMPTLRRALYRATLKVLTRVDDIWQVPESVQQEQHRVRFELDVFYHDPSWRVMWGRDSASEVYLTVGKLDFAVRPGQRILLEGVVVPARGVVVDEAKATLLGPSPVIEPLQTRGRIADIEQLNKKLVYVEGYVDRQIRTDVNSAEIDLVVEDRPVSLRVLVDGEPPAVEGMLLRARGVYSATIDPTGLPPKLEVWVAGLKDLEVLGRLEDDVRFNRAATAIEKLAASANSGIVKIVGVVRSQQPGRSLTVRDETGETIVHTAQSGTVQLGDRVEAIGVPAEDGLSWVLREGLYRRSMTTAATTGELPRLRLAEQLRELPPEEAARNYPVQLSGVVTWAHANADFFFVRDISGGVRVERPYDASEPITVGLRVDVTGVSTSGTFTPSVIATTVQRHATMDLPDAKEVTLEQALTGVEEGQWVTMSGYVRDARESGPWMRLDLTTAGGEFSAFVAPSVRLPNYRGSVVRMRGVCTAEANDRRQLTGIQLWVPSRHYIEIEEAAPSDPFEVPVRSIASLRQFNSLHASNRRVRVSGIVLSHVPGRFVHLQDGAEGLLVLSRAAARLAPGDRIEAVGFPGRESSRLVLRESIYRRTGRDKEPAPLDMGRHGVVDEEIDGRLVRIEATLLDVGAHERGVRLIAQASNLVFEALLDAHREELPIDWVPGSVLELTGVYEIQFDEYKRPHAMELRLRSPSDVRVVRRPSWWTARRALTVTGILAAGVFVGLGWVVALRRRVSQQTAQIRLQIENEKAARLEAALARASKLESLGILAGGIAHDFNNLLTVVMCNLSLAKLDPRLEADTERCLRESERAASRARDLTQQLLTFAKGGAPVRAAIMLPDVVREAAGFALHGAKARCDFDLAPDLWPADVDKGQIGQVVHNIVINANQAMPSGGVIEIALRNAQVSSGAVPALKEGRYLKLTVRDSGRGIAREDLPRIFDPYFTTKQHGSGLGLATVYSIVKQHQGHVEVESEVDVGTTFHVWLPAADRAPISPAPPSRGMPRVSGRVLFMDDEPSIRIMATAVLQRMGAEATPVNDGAAVVAEYATALAAGRPFDLVILDLTVPGGMGGAEAMEKLRAMDPKVRAIVSSGYSSDPVLANYQAYGFCGIVPKPYEASDLAKAVEAVLSDRARDGASAVTRPAGTAPVSR